MDIPDLREFSDSVITSMGRHTELGDLMDWMGTAAPISAAWPVANRAYYVPFTIQEKITAYQMLWMNGATANNGNVSIAILDSSKATLIEAHAAQSASTNTIQAIDITDTPLAPGNYYMGMACDNTTATFFRFSTIVQQLMQACGVQFQATAYPIPNPGVFSNVTSSFYLPVFGIATRSTI